MSVLSSAVSFKSTYLTGWKSSNIRCDHFDPMSIDVGEENFGSSLNNINQLVDALPTALALPVRLVQEQRLEEFFPQPPALQHWYCLIWKPRNTLKVWESKLNF